MCSLIVVKRPKSCTDARLGESVSNKAGIGIYKCLKQCKEMAVPGSWCSGAFAALLQRTSATGNRNRNTPPASTLECSHDISSTRISTGTLLCKVMGRYHSRQASQARRCQERGTPDRRGTCDTAVPRRDACKPWKSPCHPDSRMICINCSSVKCRPLQVLQPSCNYLVTYADLCNVLECSHCAGLPCLMRRQLGFQAL